MSTDRVTARRRNPSANSSAKTLLSRDTVLLLMLLAGVAISVGLVHWPALSAKAVGFDDHQYLLENPLVQRPGWASTKRFLTEVLEPSTVRGYYQPLSMISLMLDYALGGRPDNLRPFHRTSLILHVANTLLAAWLLYQLFGQPWVAALAALLFGVHPLTVETIPWTGERKTLLAAFFALLALLSYVRYTRTAGRKAYLAALLMYVLALMSKPTGTALPLVMLLLDYWPLRRFGRRALAEKIPFFIIGAGAAVITFISQARTALVHVPGEYPPARIPLVVGHNIIFYLYKIVWPANLSPHYPYPVPLDFSDPMVLAGVIGSTLLIGLLALSLRWTLALAVGWLCFFVAILPSMQIIGFRSVIAADKFVYLPAVGLLLILSWLLAGLWKSSAGGTPRAWTRTAVVLAALALCLAEARGTRRYLARWRDTETLYAYMVAQAPRAATLRYGLGNELRRQGRDQEALAELEEAVRLKPDFFRAHYQLGNLLAELGKIDQAIEHYTAAVHYRRDFSEANNNLGRLLAVKGRHAEAVTCYEQAIKYQHGYAKAHHNLGISLLSLGRTDQAIEHFRAALAGQSDFLEAHVMLGKALLAKGRRDEAIAAFRRALQINPHHRGVQQELAAALAADGANAK